MDTALWVATIPPKVLNRPTAPLVTEGGSVCSCPLCGHELPLKDIERPQVAHCPQCYLALDWAAYMAERAGQLRQIDREVASEIRYLADEDDEGYDWDDRQLAVEDAVADAEQRAGITLTEDERHSLHFRYY